jgi:hypothetical protein
MKNETSIKIVDQGHQSDLAPLYFRYKNQTNPQPAYVTLLTNGKVMADYSGEIGNGIPMDVWLGRARRYPVSPCVNGAALVDCLESDEMRDLLQRVYDGLEDVWDGNNYVGKLTQDAEDAETDIERILEGLDQTVVWDDLDQYFGELPDTDLWPEGHTLAEVETDFEKAASERDEYIASDVGQWIIDHFVWKWNNDKDIPAHVQKELLASGDISPTNWD